MGGTPPTLREQPMNNARIATAQGAAAMARRCGFRTKLVTPEQENPPLEWRSSTRVKPKAWADSDPENACRARSHVASFLPECFTRGVAFQQLGVLLGGPLGQDDKGCRESEAMILPGSHVVWQFIRDTGICTDLVHSQTHLLANITFLQLFNLRRGELVRRRSGLQLVEADIILGEFRAYKSRHGKLYQRGPARGGVH